MTSSVFSKRFTALILALLLGGFAHLHAEPLEVVSYSYDKEPSNDYPDPDRSKLTDGEIVPDQSESPYTREAAVGWIQNPPDPDVPHPTITFDLGEMKYLDEIRINYVLWPSAGVRAPAEVRVSYSMDGEEFLMEETHTGFDGTEDPEYVIFTRQLAVPVESQAARYVRLDFRQGAGDSSGPNRSVWHWFDEVTFFGREIDDVTTPAPVEIHRAVELEFPTTVGNVYQVQMSTDLEEWEDFGEKILGNGEIRQIFSSTKDRERRFFRVLRND